MSIVEASSTTAGIQVALAGNPNTGKTSLFNALTGAGAKVGNYPGVTVESRRGALRAQRDVTLVDLPGCYSLIARSPEEEVAHDTLTGRMGGAAADAVVVVVDASNLGRNLYLCQQIGELGIPWIVALNMMDLARERGLEIDCPRLSERLGVPVVPVVSVTGEGVETLAAAILSTTGSPPSMPDRWPALNEADRAVIADVMASLEQAGLEGGLGHTLWMLTSHPDSVRAHWDDSWAIVEPGRRRLAELGGGDRPMPFSRRLIAARYQRIDRLVAETVQVLKPQGRERTDRIDDVLTHPVWGMGFFALTMLLLFQAVYSWSGPLIGLVEQAMEGLGGLVAGWMPDGILRELVVDGVITGVGNILVFLPQILMLFLAVAVLEDTGYMARAAFLLDRMMRRVGLSGKSFVPLLSSFACAIPGIMAARTIESRTDRLVTIMIAPLMSCSARLPVYVMVIGAVFSASEPVLGVFSLGGLIITAMYFLGVAAALFVAWLFKRTLLQSPPPPFIMELPAYKRPKVTGVLLQMWQRGRVFVTQTGPVILALSVILWALMAYPRNELPAAESEALRARILAAEGPDGAEAADEAIEREQARYRLSESFAGTLGHGIEPLIEPLGFDWKMGIGLIGSFAAREVLVSTLGQVYGVGSDVDEESVVLRKALLADIDPATSKPRFTPLVGLSLMVFFVLAMQCLSTVAVVRRETGSWRWPIIMVVYMNVLAWVGAMLTFQVGRLMGFS